MLKLLSSLLCDNRRSTSCGRERYVGYYSGRSSSLYGSTLTALRRRVTGSNIFKSASYSSSRAANACYVKSQSSPRK